MRKADLPAEEKNADDPDYLAELADLERGQRLWPCWGYRYKKRCLTLFVMLGVGGLLAVVLILIGRGRDRGSMCVGKEDEDENGKPDGLDGGRTTSSSPGEGNHVVVETQASTSPKQQTPKSSSEEVLVGSSSDTGGKTRVARGRTLSKAGASSRVGDRQHSLRTSPEDALLKSPEPEGKRNLVDAKGRPQLNPPDSSHAPPRKHAAHGTSRAGSTVASDQEESSSGNKPLARGIPSNIAGAGLAPAPGVLEGGRAVVRAQSRAGADGAPTPEDTTSGDQHKINPSATSTTTRPVVSAGSPSPGAPTPSQERAPVPLIAAPAQWVSISQTPRHDIFPLRHSWDANVDQTNKLHPQVSSASARPSSAGTASAGTALLGAQNISAEKTHQSETGTDSPLKLNHIRRRAESSPSGEAPSSASSSPRRAARKTKDSKSSRHRRRGRGGKKLPFRVLPTLYPNDSSSNGTNPSRRAASTVATSPIDTLAAQLQAKDAEFSDPPPGASSVSRNYHRGEDPTQKIQRRTHVVVGRGRSLSDPASKNPGRGGLHELSPVPCISPPRERDPSGEPEEDQQGGRAPTPEQDGGGVLGAALAPIPRGGRVVVPQQLSPDPSYVLSAGAAISKNPVVQTSAEVQRKVNLFGNLYKQESQRNPPNQTREESPSSYHVVQGARDRLQEMLQQYAALQSSSATASASRGQQSDAASSRGSSIFEPAVIKNRRRSPGPQPRDRSAPRSARGIGLLPAQWRQPKRSVRSTVEVSPEEAAPLLLLNRSGAASSGETSTVEAPLSPGQYPGQTAGKRGTSRDGSARPPGSVRILEVDTHVGSFFQNAGPHEDMCSDEITAARSSVKNTISRRRLSCFSIPWQLCRERPGSSILCMKIMFFVCSGSISTVSDREHLSDVYELAEFFRVWHRGSSCSRRSGTRHPHD